MKNINFPEIGIDKEELLELFNPLFTSLVKDGYITVKGKSPKQIAAQLQNIIGKYEIVFGTDHTDDILIQARIFRKEQKREFACLFYALWIEHTLNGIVSSLAKSKLSEKEILSLIRDTSYKSKLTWLLHLLEKKPFSQSHINSITKLMELRNSFVHYKWQADNEHVEREIESALLQIEKTVKYIQDFERINLYGVSKRKIKNLTRRA